MSKRAEQQEPEAPAQPVAREQIMERLSELEKRKSHGRVEIHLLEGRITHVEFCERVSYR